MTISKDSLVHPLEKYAYKYLIFTYLLSFMLYLFNNIIYWDDWVIFYQNKEVIQKFFDQTGSLHNINAIIFNFFLPLDFGIYLSRFIIFLSYMFSSVLVFLILKTISEIHFYERFLITLIFSVIPINFSKMLIINEIYALCHLFFYFSFYLFIKYLNTRSILARLFSLLFLFCSFLTNSISLFFIVIFIYLIYYNKSKITKIADIVKLFFKYIDFIVIAVIFLYIKFIVYPSYGLYDNYNQINKPVLLILSFLLISFMVGLLYFFLKKRELFSKKITLLVLGLVLIYAVVGKIPNLFNYESRHFLLFPLGFSITFYAFFSLILRKINLKLAFFSLYISIFCIINILGYLGIQRDGLKRLAIIENFKNSDKIKNNSHFIYINQSKKLDSIYFNSNYNFYEYTGMMK